MSDTAQDYRDTVFLPKTDFPMRGDLPKREPALLARWEAMGLWDRLRAESAGREKFILHDGPPYANGHLHIGTALNKILKDVVNRAAQKAGFDALYIPGWDCHGLPIEWKIEEEYRARGEDKDAIPVLQFRDECRQYAARWMAIQEAEFRRLGVFGAWKSRYATMDHASEGAIAGEICKFLMNGALYRGLRPVMWSPVEKTALAEAEIEYHDHTSHTVFVRFPVVASPVDLDGASVVIWTTTPWTMPGNRAIACGEEFDYALVRIDSVAPGSLARPGEKILVALALLPQIAEATGIATHHVLRLIAGRDLVGTICAHPLRGRGYDHDVPVYSADYVTTDAGTGFVHIAPGHGEEDFDLGRKHNIEIPETVGEDGTFNPWMPLFAGLHVYKAADPVAAALTEAGGLLARGKLVHSYPHSWRSRAPLIFRATAQWFIRMDGPENIRAAAIQAIADTKFVPDQGRNRIGGMVATRPDWCVSRQRAWGVPIAIFVEKATGVPLRDQTVVDRIVAAFRAEGADCWYSSPSSRFLGPDRDPDAFEQVMDIVDVWFESGCTHAFVLEDRGLPWPADLYLEGSDQHRGWFHSSLLESVGTRGRAPFKSILTHGFVMDEQGRKMSKSLGNVVAPEEVNAKYGADILRLWVMSTDITEDMRIGPEILKQQSETYRRLRNTMRWLLGALDGFDPAEILPYADLPELERYVLHRVAEIDAMVRKAVAAHDWTGIYPAIHNFCGSDLSAFYFDVRKDAVYCDLPTNLRRRAARTVLDILHRALTTWLAPVLVFTCDEAWCARFGEADSVHLHDYLTPEPTWHDTALGERWTRIREQRRLGTIALEEMRRAGQIGSSLQAVVGFAPGDDAKLLSEELWAEILIVPAVRLDADQPVTAAIAHGDKCARCWKVLPEVGSTPAHPGLCLRCVEVVAA
ncbi:MAG: isoleucine--tRNA ligase [Acetobacteraceae bacterium]|nr:isoleucine--tRNA ligase [Acetobacteraceae bacterium]